MPEGDLSLNAVGYVLRPFDHEGRRALIHRYLVEQFGASYRLAGRQRLEDVTNHGVFVVPNLMLGHGRYRIASDSAFSPDEYRRFFDAQDIETRFAEIRLGILAEDSTEPATGEVVRASAPFKGEILTLLEDDTGASGKRIATANYTGSTTTWDYQDTGLSDATEGVALDCIAAGDYFVALIAESNDHITLFGATSTASLGTSPFTEITANLLTNVVTANEDIDAGLLAYDGTQLIAVIWEETNGLLAFFSAPHPGSNLVEWANENIDIASGNGPQGLVVFDDIDGVQKLYVGSREGLYVVDTSVATWTKRLIYPMPASNDNCRRMTVNNGKLWFAQGVDDDSPAPIITMEIRGDQRIFDTSMGLNVGDGVPDEMLGPIRYMRSSGAFLYASVGGGKASRNARVICWNGKGWHTVYRHGTANVKVEWLDISADDDGTPRLHFSVRSAASTSTLRFLAYPDTNPQSGISKKYEADGFIDLPYMDIGMPLDSKAWLRIGVNAVDLSADNTGEYINADYGGDDGSGGLEARNANDLGDFLAATSTIKFASGAGLKSRNLGLRINLHRAATNTKTPKLKDIEVAALPQRTVLQGFLFLIDLGASAEILDKDAEGVVTTLETARDLGTLPALTYGNIGTKYVKIRSIGSADDLYEPGGLAAAAADALAQRGGTVLVRAEEVI